MAKISEKLAEIFEKFKLRETNPDGLPDSQGGEEVHPGGEGMELPVECDESGSIDVMPTHQPSSRGLEEVCSVESTNPIGLLEGTAGPSRQGGRINESAEEATDANEATEDENSLPSGSDQHHQRGMPADEQSDSHLRVRNPIDQPSDLRENGEGQGAEKLSGLRQKNPAEEHSTRDALGRYRQIHTREKPLTCEYCEKTFTFASGLKRHRRTHTGEKPFKCNVCGRGFSQSGHLNQHLKTHTNEKTFRCDVCGKTYNLLGVMKRHRRIHTTKNPTA